MSRKVRTEIDVDEAIVEGLLAAPAAARIVVVGVDIGARTGVAALVADVAGGAPLWRWSTQDTPGLAIDALGVALGGKPAHLAAVEAPFTVSREGMMKGSITPTTIFSMGESSGYAKRALEPLVVSGVPLWRPMPSTWRSLLGLNGGKRDEVNNRVHRWAEATAGYPMRTHNGHPALDEANAFGIASAALDVARAILRRKP